MRDCSVITSAIEHDHPDHGAKSHYKEIVIIGNGPSGITLSYLLSGHCPYYNRKAHPDPMLSARLIECTQKSLLHQDLAFLSQGIEGRSKNPVSLLIDSMNHPGADMGIEWPSLLSWKKCNKALDHVVLGKGQLGGTWQGVADNVLTISPGRWMALPGMEFREYREDRAPAAAVAQYYTEYIESNNLSQYMVPNTTVTLVQSLSGLQPRRRARWRVWVHDANGSTISYECRHLVLATGASDRAGCLGVPGESFPYVTHDLRVLEERMKEGRKERLILPRHRLLLKTKSNSSLLSGEPAGRIQSAHVLRSSDNIPLKMDTDLELGRNWVYDSSVIFNRSKSHLDQRDNVFEALREQRKGDGEDDENSVLWRRRRNLSLNELFERRPSAREGREGKDRSVLVVGAGLSAADAILTARREGYSVIHAFRRTVPAPLPAVMYPEYNEVYHLMQGLTTSPDYTSFPGYQVSEFFDDSTVLLSDPEGNTHTVKISMAAILIGSQPDLSFLPKKLRNLGTDQNKPVDCKVNPIYVEPFSYRCVRAPPGLYALGPLVGDNFVRFLQGGAVAVASQIYKETNLQACP